MKKHLRTIIAVAFLLTLLTPLGLIARDVEPIVSASWVEQNLDNPRVVVLDVRKVEDYKEGHIRNAVNAIYGSWAITKGGLRNELPAKDDLFDTIGSAGIGPDSIVIVVGKVDGMPERTDTTRVAWTLKYAGVSNVALLDGGYNKWLADKKPVSTDPFRPKSKSYQGKTNDNLFATKDYIMKAAEKAVVVDVREPDYYKGLKKMDFVNAPGHIAKAVNMPATLAYNADGTFKSKGELANMASSALGNDMEREIVTSCDTGKVCTSWSFLLSELLGYKNVKVYDGSAEDWTKEPAGPVEK